MFQAILRNGHHPEYGVVTIPFPIPDEEYDHCMELLETLGIGDAVRRDCQVKELHSDYPVLKKLELTKINLDELDYLAKRLDSFDRQDKVALSSLFTPPRNAGREYGFQTVSHRLAVYFCPFRCYHFLNHEIKSAISNPPVAAVPAGLAVSQMLSHLFLMILKVLEITEDKVRVLMRIDPATNQKIKAGKLRQLHRQLSPRPAHG